METLPMETLPEWEERLSSLPCVVHCFKEVDSTMNVARDFAVQDATSPRLILTEHQTAGRGRLGRSWDATSKGFAGTYVFFTENHAGSMQGYSLVVGCALVAALKRAGVEMFLKWPNDILTASGQKAGGVLIELLTLHGKTCVLTGIGLNSVNASASYERSGAIFESAADARDVCGLAELITVELLSAFKRFEAGGFSLFQQEWLKSAYALNQPLSISVGEKLIHGVFTGVDEHGTLMLEVEGENRGYPGAQIVRE